MTTTSWQRVVPVHTMLSASIVLVGSWCNLCRYVDNTAQGHRCCLQERDLKRLHEGAIKNDPFIKQALGPNAQIERMKAASLRLGGQGLRTTYDDHLVIIGDAAGHIDPLTGEGIHTAIMVSLHAPQP